jgi:hypothetical protein
MYLLGLVDSGEFQKARTYFCEEMNDGEREFVLGYLSDLRASRKPKTF